jgi:hypothetical protein
MKAPALNNSIMNRSILSGLTLLALALGRLHAATLDEGFLAPPESTKPSCYWYWISDNISKEGITRDLEGMRRVGIGEAFIGNIYLDDTKIGDVKALTEEWWGMVEHAIREGGRIGVKVGMFNCPGWSQSGGPWIKPGQAMRYVALAEQKVSGPSEFTGKLAAPNNDFQDIALLAFPSPKQQSPPSKPTLRSDALKEGVERLVDGDTGTGVAFPSSGVTMDIEFPSPITARSLMLVPERKDFIMNCELFVEREGKFASIQKFPMDRSNNSVPVGFARHAPVAISFEAVSASKFRLVFSNIQNNAGLAEARLSSEPMIERHIEKQLAKMHPTPLPLWADYLWPDTSEPGDREMIISPEAVHDLTGKLQPDGSLRWTVPPGEWVILRCGMTPTGTKNSPASPQGQGLEVDKMNRKAAQDHFDAYIGKLLSRFKSKSERAAFERVIADSYEMGSQNWTDGLRELFQKRHGYDPRPWLPTLTGRVVGSADKSDRFLWDLRRLVADQVAYEYVGGLRDACHKHGLRLWLENYGHWGFPAEFLQYGGQSDDLGGEFWTSGGLGSVELRAASSAVHTYGKPRVSAEAFTSGSKFEGTPWSLKKRGDWAMTEGINHWVLHVNIHQPWEDKQPGVNAWFSTEFNRHNPWFFPGKEFIDYYRRCHYLLQQGRHSADVAYFIGEDTPKMTGVQEPALPPGYNFDYINAEVILSRLTVENGRFTLPDGMSYSVLALPPMDTMRPELLAKISALAKAGGVLIGNPPSRSPSMENYPKADQKVAALAGALWKGCDGKNVKRVSFGKGRVYRNTGLKQIFDELSIPPQIAGCDFSKIAWTHRSADDAEIFFLSNQADKPQKIAPAFRAIGKAPELWNPASKRITRPAIYSAATGRVAIELEPRGSIFVVFREKAGDNSEITQAARDGKVISGLASDTGKGAVTRDTVNSFTTAAWVLPKASIGLPEQADSGVCLNQVRNELVTAPHGSMASGKPDHACAGISVGTNGVVVYEHTGSYYAPILSCAADIREWTHLAVAYSDGRPALYLNGRKAREGLQSKYVVHSGLAVDANAASSFNGKFSGLDNFAGALDAAAILAMAGEPRPGGSQVQPLALTRASGGAILAEVSEPGDYTLRFANGQERKFTAPAIAAPTDVSGPWTLSFPAKMDVPVSVKLDKLASLSEHANAAVRHFSGTVAYRTEFEMPPVGGDTRVILSLGDLEGVAELELNGKPLGVLWKPPFNADVTTTIRPGKNDLVARVSGTWLNRMIGDAKYPNGFPSESGETRPLEFKPFVTADLKLTGNEPLQPFGLLGPVTVSQVRQIRVD